MVGGTEGRYWRRIAVVCSGGGVAIAVLAATGSAKDPKVTFTAVDALDPVTAGLNDVRDLQRR